MTIGEVFGFLLIGCIVGCAKGDTSFSVSYQYAVPWKDIAVANGIDPDSALKPGTTLVLDGGYLAR